MAKPKYRSSAILVIFLFASIFLLATSCSINKDKEAPIIRLNGPDTLTVVVGKQFHDPGLIAFDNEDLDISEKVVTTGDVNTDSIGKYELQYSSSDLAGNTATSKRTVFVIHPYSYLMGLNYTATSTCFPCPIDAPGYVSNCIFPDCPEFRVTLRSDFTQFHMQFSCKIDGFKLRVKNQINTIICYNTYYQLLGGDGRVSTGQDSLFFDLDMQEGNRLDTLKCQLTLFR